MIVVVPWPLHSLYVSRRPVQQPINETVASCISCGPLVVESTMFS